MPSLKQALDGFSPDTALILGSGLGGVAKAVRNAKTVPYGELDGFPQGGVSGHAGALVAGELGKHKVAVLSGREHYYEHGNAAAMRNALEQLAQVGVTKLVATNSAGSLRKKVGPGAVMQINDHINFSGTNPLIGEQDDSRFVGLTSAYDFDLIKSFRRAAKREDIALSKGTYMWFSGPTFETPAEIRMAKMMGADAVGMSTVPEVILARFLGLRVAAFSCITNLGAGMTGDELSHEETKENGPKAGLRLQAILENAFAKGLK
jgi:purine-nucleoside phosphorylase